MRTKENQPSINQSPNIYFFELEVKIDLIKFTKEVVITLVLSKRSDLTYYWNWNLSFQRCKFKKRMVPVKKIWVIADYKERFINLTICETLEIKVIFIILFNRSPILLSPNNEVPVRRNGNDLYLHISLPDWTKQLSAIRDTLSLDCSSRSHVLVRCGKKRVRMRPRVWGWLMTCVSDVDRSEGNWVVTLSCTAPLARQDVCECSE